METEKYKNKTIKWKIFALAYECFMNFPFDPIEREKKVRRVDKKYECVHWDFSFAQCETFENIFFSFYALMLTNSKETEKNFCCRYLIQLNFPCAAVILNWIDKECLPLTTIT